MSLENRQLIQEDLERMKERTEIALSKLVQYAGISRSTWQEWEKRKEEATKHNNNLPKCNWLTPNEELAIVNYCKDKLHLGYRRLTWMMVDANIAATSQSSVYNVLKRNDLTKKWDTLRDEHQKGYIQPVKPHEQWHTDFSYIKINGNFYYFAGVLDGFSRMILAWNLFATMDAWTVETVVSRAKELYPAAKPRLITDNGKQFVAQDFKELVALLEIEHTFIRAGHPQSNGKIERFHRTLKTEEVRTSAYFGAADAKKRLASYIEYYNTERLHSAIRYLTPKEVLEGKTEQRLAERHAKCHTARINRQEFWQNQALVSPYLETSNCPSSV